ncbi:MAG: glycogen-binding domain-containing protein [Treponema sp.]|nr:glycogen-binding domain-containing protein [Treponema sp.]
MKRISFFVIFTLISSFSWAQQGWETYELINSLMSMQKPGAPVVHEDAVIFTADSGLRRVGVAFAHENFEKTYWFSTLMIVQDFLNPIILPGEKEPSPYKDSGIQFYVYKFPANLRELEYRMIINGLWTVDPANPAVRRDSLTGLNYSVLRLPQRQTRPDPLDGLPDGLRFTFSGSPGEIVTVAGTFNSWDPFMYEMREGPSGFYSITIPLPPGTYQYVFFHRGQRFIDPHNPRRAYARNGSAASEITVP